MVAIQLVDAQRLSPYQYKIIGLCIFLTLFDGFDLFAMSFVAPVLSDEWSLSPEILGFILSAAFLGMVLGSLFIAPLSDYYGRRRLILISVGILTVATFLTAFANSTTQLIILRFFTGLGVGSMLPCMTSIIVEFSPDRHRNFTVSVMHVSAPIGGVLGGVVTAAILENFGWQSVFLVAGTLTAIIWLVSYFLLPESLEFMLVKGSKDELLKVNRILERMNRPPLQAWPENKAEVVGKSGIKGLFEGDLLKWTPLLWICAFISLFGLFFIQNWLPKIAVDAGIPLAKAIYISVIFNLGAAIGIVAFGYYSSVVGIRKLLLSFYLACAALLIIFGLSPANALVLGILSLFIGVFFFGASVGNYVVAARLFNLKSRSTGVGWTTGIGRIGGVISPVVAGF